MEQRLRNLELVQKCDAFPDRESSPQRYDDFMASLYSLVWDDDDGTGEYAIGYVRPAVLEALVRLTAAEKKAFGFVTDMDLAAIAAATRTIPLHRLLALQTDEPGRTRAVAALAAYWREHATFRLLTGWRDELWPVYGRAGQLLFSMERAAMGLFGTARYGVHLTVYVAGEEIGQPRIWVPKRSPTKSTYPGMLDNTVAGGLMTGEDPFECLVREADEEASLPAAVLRAQTHPAGTITYVSLPDARAGGEPGAAYVYPECQWIYDLRLTPAQASQIVPQPKDGEVESFALCTVAEIREQLARGLYKPNCAVVMLDFLIRHGLLTAADEPDYDAILPHLHRPLPFPGPHEEAWLAAKKAREAKEAKEAKKAAE